MILLLLVTTKSLVPHPSPSQHCPLSVLCDGKNFHQITSEANRYAWYIIPWISLIIVPILAVIRNISNPYQHRLCDGDGYLIKSYPRPLSLSILLVRCPGCQLRRHHNRKRSRRQFQSNHRRRPIYSSPRSRAKCCRSPFH